MTTMTNDSMLQRTANWFRAIGTVNEKALELGECEVKVYKDGQDTGKKAKSDCIKGKVSIRTDKGILTFPVWFAKTGMDGNEAKNWKMAKAMYDNWIPAVGNGASNEPTLVAIEGNIEINDYPTQTGEIRSNLQWRIKSANTRVNPEEPHAMSLTTTAFIKAINHEVVGENETGRLKVSLLGVNNKGACYPIETFVEADLADDFEELYEAGQTVEFDVDIVNHHVGGQKTKRAFGKGSTVSVNSGFDILEYRIVGAGEPIEEPDELEDEDGNPIKTKWVNPKAMKKALTVRQAMLEQMAKDAKDGKIGNKKSSGSELSNAKKKLGTAKAHVEEPVGGDDEEDLDW